HSDAALFTSDHVLDSTFPVASIPLHAAGAARGARGAGFRDVDALAAAADFGTWPREGSQTIRAIGSHVLDHLGDFSWAFDPEWEAIARRLAGESEGVPGADGPVRAELGAASAREKSFAQEHRSI